MSYDESLRTITLEAAADLSAKQYHFVTLGTTGVAFTAVAGQRATGVLQTDPTALGRPANIAVGGVTKIVAGGPITRGNMVASKNDGRAQVAASTNTVLGIALETSVNNGDIISMLWSPGHIVP